ncbi:MAG: SMC-Scp complex subunit ScpB, partial [Chloroflexota bacterium]
MTDQEPLPVEAPLDPAALEAFFEAVLFIAEKPLATDELAALAGVAPLQAEGALSNLAEELDARERGIRLQHHDGAWQLATAPRLGARLAAYAAREEARLTPAALEALAIIAYRQPCTRGEVERVRGVDSDYVIRSLLHRRLIVEVGRRDTPGRPALFGTTFTFLERFGLTGTEDLPPLESAAAQAIS